MGKSCPHTGRKLQGLYPRYAIQFIQHICDEVIIINGTQVKGIMPQFLLVSRIFQWV
jgi:hypothetical protein